MAHATHDEVRVLRRYVSDDDFKEALDKAPPGIIDPRSWAYWNSKMGRYPPPLSIRRFEDIMGPEKLDFMQSLEDGNPLATRKHGLENEQPNATTAWQKMCQQKPPPVSLKDTRRRAREEWLAKCGPRERN